MTNILEVKNLSLSSPENGTKLLHKVNFSVAPGEIHSLLGKNGSGKSTLAYALMGLKQYDYRRGGIFFEGQDISREETHQRARRGMTLTFQEPCRFEGLTVRDFFQAGNKKAGEKEIKKNLDLVGLSADFADRRIDENLSGGERKRLEIASVIIMKPKLIIMDEPDASLDIIVYNEFYDLLINIKEELSCSILLITHREEAGIAADRATLLEEGKTVDTGDFRQVMRLYCSRMGRQTECHKNKRCCQQNCGNKDSE